MKPCQELNLTSRISDERSPSLNAVDGGSESLSATLCPTKGFSEYLEETILASVEALGHNVVMLHSDQEPVLVQLLKLCRADESSEHW